MKEFKFLKILDLFHKAFEACGYDYKLLRKILQLKLTMDNRRTSTVFQNNQKKTPDSNYNFLKSLGIYMFMGLVLIPFILMDRNYIFQMSIVFAIMMFFIMTSLISDFSSVLLDLRDRNVLGTKPVPPKTLRVAKTIHVSYYLISISFVLAGPALITSLIKDGLGFFLLFIVFIVLLDLFCIVLTTFIYFLILRFFDGEKLKDIINYVQIILSLVIMVGYQLVSRLFSIVDLQITFTPKWWQYFLAPVWFSAPFQMLKTKQVTTTFLVFSCLAVLVPILAIAWYHSFSSEFEKYLLKLSNYSISKKKRTKNPGQILSAIFCRNQEERVFFRFATDMMKNEREFKLKVYPSLGFSIALPFIFLFQQIMDSGLKEISQGKSYLFIYFCGLMLPSVLLMIRHSAGYKGAWIYQALPIHQVSSVYRGTMKAMLFRLFLPFFLVESVIFTAICGVRILPQLLVILLNLLLVSILYFMLDRKQLPFSLSFEGMIQSNIGLTFLLMFVLTVLAGIHFFLLSKGYVVYVYAPIAAVLNLVLWKLAFRMKKLYL